MTLRVTCPHCGQRNTIEEVKTKRDGDGLALDLGWCESCQGDLAEIPDSRPPAEQRAEARKLARSRSRLVRQFNGLIRGGASAADLAALQGEIDRIEERLTELGL